MDTPTKSIPTTFRIGLFLVAMLCIGIALGVSAHPAEATDTDSRYFDHGFLRSATGTAVIDSAAGVWTGFLPIVTCTPTPASGMSHVDVVIDLATTTTGWATVATSETIIFSVQRAVDGTNYRSDAQDQTTAITGTNSAGRCVTLHLNNVGPGEKFKIAAKLSAEVAVNPNLPYVIYYFAPDRATFSASQ